MPDLHGIHVRPTIRSAHPAVAFTVSLTLSDGRNAHVECFSARAGHSLDATFSIACVVVEASDGTLSAFSAPSDEAQFAIREDVRKIIGRDWRALAWSVTAACDKLSMGSFEASPRCGNVWGGDGTNNESMDADWRDGGDS